MNRWGFFTVIAASLLLTACSSPASRAEGVSGGGRGYVFDLSALPEITIRISEGEWNRLLAAIDRNKSSVPYVKADFTFEKNGRRESVSRVGFRIRGGAFSRVRPEVAAAHQKDAGTYRQAHFKVSFSKFSDGRRFHTLRTLNIKMFKGDPAMVREVFAMDFLRRSGVRLAHRSSFVRLKIHILSDSKPVYFGVFRMNEVVDKTFIRDRFPEEKEGFLWKCLWPADLRASTVKSGRAQLGDGKKGRTAYELKTREKEFRKAKGRFLDFMRDLEGLEDAAFVPWVEKQFAVKPFLKAMAGCVLLGHWDDYRFNNNNFYFYFNTIGRAHFIPYDLDNVLGTAIFDTGRVSIWSVSDRRPLVKRILQVPAYRKYYASCIRAMVDSSTGLFTPEAAAMRLQEWRMLIEEYLPNRTGTRETVRDAPGAWGRMPQYRLFSKTGTGGENFFAVRRKAALAQLALPGLVENDSKLQNPAPPRGGPVIKKKLRVENGFKAWYPGMFLRGYFNGWGTTPLKLVADFTWEGEFTSPQLSKYGFKFATGPNWGRDLDWGEASPKNDGRADPNTGSGRHINYSGPGRYRVRFNTKTMAYRVLKLR